jgi:hypothetical protein
MRHVTTILAVLAAICGHAAEPSDDVYLLSATSENRYKVEGIDTLLTTSNCDVRAKSARAVLRSERTNPNILFLDDGRECRVKALYRLAPLRPAKYRVKLSRVGEDWYRLDGRTGINDFVRFIPSSQCPGLKSGQRALLNVPDGRTPNGGSGVLEFSGEQSDCAVDKLFQDVLR